MRRSPGLIGCLDHPSPRSEAGLGGSARCHRPCISPQRWAVESDGGNTDGGRRAPHPVRHLELLIAAVTAPKGKRMGHAGAIIAGGKASSRPPIATERLSLSPDGRVVYELRRPWRDGTTHFVFDPLTFLERLAALVPHPREHGLTYHGVLAPASSWRDEIVPARRVSDAGLATIASPAPRAPAQPLWGLLQRRLHPRPSLPATAGRS